MLKTSKAFPVILSKTNFIYLKSNKDLYGYKIGKLVTKPDHESFPVEAEKRFLPLPQWKNALKETLAESAEKCPTLQAFALHQQQGYLNINDQRAGVFGRVNDPSDIFGTCLLDGKGNIVKGTFELMPTHVLYTKQDGLSTLTPFLHQELIKKLKLEPVV